MSPTVGTSETIGPSSVIFLRKNEFMVKVLREDVIILLKNSWEGQKKPLLCLSPWCLAFPPLSLHCLPKGFQLCGPMCIRTNKSLHYHKVYLWRKSDDWLLVLTHAPREPSKEYSPPPHPWEVFWQTEFSPFCYIPKCCEVLLLLLFFVGFVCLFWIWKMPTLRTRTVVRAKQLSVCENSHLLKDLLDKHHMLLRVLCTEHEAVVSAMSSLRCVLSTVEHEHELTTRIRGLHICAVTMIMIAYVISNSEFWKQHLNNKFLKCLMWYFIKVVAMGHNDIFVK